MSGEIQAVVTCCRRQGCRRRTAHGFNSPAAAQGNHPRILASIQGNTLTKPFTGCQENTISGLLIMLTYTIHMYKA